MLRRNAARSGPGSGPDVKWTRWITVSLLALILILVLLGYNWEAVLSSIATTVFVARDAAVKIYRSGGVPDDQSEQDAGQLELWITAQQTERERAEREQAEREQAAQERAARELSLWITAQQAERDRARELPPDPGDRT